MKKMIMKKMIMKNMMMKNKELRLNQIKVGNQYVRPLGINKQYVIVQNINDDGWVDIVTKSGSRKFKTEISNISKWTLLKQAEIKKTKSNKKRLNEKTFLEVLIETLKNNQHPMITRQLVDKIVENKSFIFKDTAKTPYEK